MPQAENIICETNFDFTVSLGNIPATIDIISEDENKSVRINQQFTITAKYTIGRPNVLAVPFDVDIIAMDGNIRKRVEILSVTPSSPNLNNVGDEEEQTVVVTAVVLPLQTSDPNQEQSESGGTLDISISIAMFQPRFGSIDTSAVYHTDADDEVVPNLRSTEFGDTLIVAWDAPTNDEGEKQPVDVRVKVSTANQTRGRITYWGRVIENITVAYELLKEITASSSAPLEEAETAEVEICVKTEDGIFSSDGETSRCFSVTHPLRRRIEHDALIPVPTNMELVLTQDPGRPLGNQIYQLRWDQPYWTGDPVADINTFRNLFEVRYTSGGTLNPSTRQLSIAKYQYRFKVDDGEFGAWRDVYNSYLDDDTIRRLNSPDDIVRIIQWPSQTYASVVDSVRVFPWPNTVAPEGHTYTFQGRAIASDLTHSQTIRDVVTI